MKETPEKMSLILAHDNATCSLGKWLPRHAANVLFHTGGAAAVLLSRSVPLADGCGDSV